MEALEKGGWLYRCTVALLAVLIVVFFGLWTDAGRAESPVEGAIAWCTVSLILAIFFLIEAKRAFTPPITFFEINRVKRYYHKKGKEQRYRNICRTLFLVSLLGLLVNAIRAVIIAI